MSRASAHFRRGDLLRWMSATERHEGRTASQIVEMSGIYEGHGRVDRCFDDLKALAKKGRVRREGRPARWWLA